MIIMLPAIGYGAVKGYLWYDFKGKVDEVVKQSAAFADISYGGIHTDLEGVIGVNKLVIKPKMAPGDVYEVDALRFTMPNILYFLDASKKLEQGGIPETMGVSVKGFRFDLDGEMLKMMSQMGEMQQQMAMAQGGQPPAPASTTFDALGCGKVTTIGLNEMKRMGYGRVESDFKLKFDYDESDDSFTVDVSGGTDNMYSFDVNTSFTVDPAVITSPMMAASGMAAGPQFRRMRIDYSDDGYNGRRNSFCAAQSGETAEKFVDRHIELLAAELGASFSKKVVDGYRDFMLKPGGKMQFVMYPGTATDLSGLGLYTPEQIVKMLGVEVSINDTPIQEGDIDWIKGGPVARVEPEEKKVVVVPQEYRVVAIADLDNYIGRAVKVTTSDGREREGRLAKVDAYSVTVEKRMKGGTISIPIVIEKISGTEVFH